MLKINNNEYLQYDHPQGGHTVIISLKFESATTIKLYKLNNIFGNKNANLAELRVPKIFDCSVYDDLLKGR